MGTKCEPALYDHGILNETSDIRAHVGVVVRKVYVFRTRVAAELLRGGHQYRSVRAFQPGVAGATASGFLVPPDDIPGMRILAGCKDDRWWSGFTTEYADTSAKGDAAVAVVTRLLRHGFFPLWIDADESGDRSIQRSGTDIIVCCNQRIEVKCDWHAGNPAKSGCLFLQTAERNPLRKI